MKEGNIWENNLSNISENLKFLTIKYIGMDQDLFSFHNEEDHKFLLVQSDTNNYQKL